MHKTVMALHGQTVRFNALSHRFVLRITLPCGLQFAFDPTAIQYGWLETIAPWSAYIQHRAHNGVREVVIKQPMDVGVDAACARMQNTPLPDWDTPFAQAVRDGRRRIMEHVAMEINIVVLYCLPMFHDAESIVPGLLMSTSEDTFQAV